MKYTNARCAVKYASLVVMGFVFCVLFSGTASAQCYFVYSANYAVYTSFSTDGNRIFTSVLTDGSASMTIAGQYCGPGYQIMQNQINSATHTPSSYNVIGGTGGWGTGSSGCVNCYLSYQNNQSIAATPGVTYSGQETGQINCSVGGAIFAPPINLFDAEIAYTRSWNTGVKVATFNLNGATLNSWAILPYCNLATSPPDWDPGVYNAPVSLPPSSVYFIDGLSACVRINLTGAPWFCTPGASIGWPQSFNLAPAACTHNP